ncbi:hypothetical protein BDZ89DRAFT_627712 [Hymenopellis radicata]|nr:hypothetical protein BDZ89DRAFT_627712 [Hymenopellis radicata]
MAPTHEDSPPPLPPGQKRKRKPSAKAAASTSKTIGVDAAEGFRALSSKRVFLCAMQPLVLVVPRLGARRSRTTSPLMVTGRLAPPQAKSLMVLALHRPSPRSKGLLNPNPRGRHRRQPQQPPRLHQPRHRKGPQSKTLTTTMTTTTALVVVQRNPPLQIKRSSVSLSILSLYNPSANPVADNRRKTWRSPIYAFFGEAYVEYVEGRKAHVFPCGARGCTINTRRFQDSKDANSSGRLRAHAVKCWGKDAIDAADDTTLEGTREALKQHAKHPSKGIKSFFPVDGWPQGEHLILRHTTYTCPDTCRMCSLGVGELQTVCNCRRPRLQEPYEERPARTLHSTSDDGLADTKNVFAKMRQRLSKLFREYEGDLNVAIDGWTSQNHGAFIAITVHLIIDGEVVNVLLDFLEVAEVCPNPG